MNAQKKTIVQLFTSFSIISATAFGGAAIIMMRRAAAKHGWLTEREFLDIYALAQVAPGAIPVTLAVLIGRHVAGIWGFWACLVAETVPGFVVLMVLALLSMNPHMGILRSALKGCAAAAVGMMIGNALEMSWPYRAKVLDVVLMVAVGTAVLVFHFTLALMFVVFIPISIFAQRLAHVE